MPSSRRPYVVEIRVRGHVYLYYRRSGERVRLVGPEGSAAFNDSYDQVHRRFEQPASEPWGPHTVGQGITEYLDSADFRQLALASQRQYRWGLDLMRERIGREVVIERNVFLKNDYKMLNRRLRRCSECYASVVRRERNPAANRK